ncbi:unnamed protein product, partial [Clonostachys chloroleuca]
MESSKSEKPAVASSPQEADATDTSREGEISVQYGDARYLTGWKLHALTAGLMIIIAKLSDVFSRKSVLVLSLAVFTIFSGACAAAKTMIQL